MVNHKTKAHYLVNKALDNGTISKPSECEVCNRPNKRIIGHHDDYSKPLDVKWVCPGCHQNFHGKIRKPRKMLTIRLDEEKLHAFRHYCVDAKCKMQSLIESWIDDCIDWPDCGTCSNWDGDNDGTCPHKVAVGKCEWEGTND